MPNVDYVFLAEFDINKGSVLRHRYPSPAGRSETEDDGDEQHLLAEHMLPDGAHDRSDDCTVFYLNQIPQMTISTGGLEQESQLLYVLSLVRTKKVATVRRGALVKALAVATHSPFIQIYKPILLLALDAYFEDPTIECLAKLYHAINAMDVAACPVLSFNERTILRTSERTDLLLEKFGPLQDARRPSLASLVKEEQEFTRTPSMSMSSSQYDRHSVTSFSTSSRLSIPTPTEDFPPPHLRPRVFTNGSSNSIDIPIPNDSIERIEGIASGRRPPKDTHWFETSIDYNSITLPVRIPLTAFPEDVGQYSMIKLVQTFSSPTTLLPATPLHPHLHTNGLQTHPIMLLFNALVTHKRVVFLGHGLPAEEVASLVLAACALGSGCGAIINGFVKRAFPYTNLSNLDNLQAVPGFIAGVCNPAFADRPSWWDVLCNIETGKIIVSKDIAPSSSQPSSFTPSLLRMSAIGSPRVGPGEGGISSYMDAETEDSRSLASKADPDNIFMDEIATAISSHYGESIIRARFTDHVQRFTRLASRYEEETTGSTTIGFASSACNFRQGSGGTLGSGAVFLGEEGIKSREMLANIGRIEGWRGSPSYLAFQKTFRESLESDPIQGLDLVHQVARLRQGRNVPDGEVALILSTLAESIQSDEEIVALLTRLPPHFGGLLSLGFGLFHPAERVRNSTVNLFNTLNAHPTGKRFIDTLNIFHRSAYLRLAQNHPLPLLPPPIIAFPGSPAVAL